MQTEEKTVEYGHEGYNAEILQYARWADGRVYERSFPSYYDPVDTVITYNKDPKKQKLKRRLPLKESEGSKGTAGCRQENNGKEQKR